MYYEIYTLTLTPDNRLLWKPHSGYATHKEARAALRSCGSLAIIKKLPDSRLSTVLSECSALNKARR